MAIKKRLKSFELPKIDYKVARHSWFVHAGVPYPVVSAPDDVFRATMYAQSPQWRRSAEYSRILKQDELDYQTRWYLLNALADKHRELALYASREQAERVCAEQMAG